MESSESMLNDKEALSISLSLLQDYFTTDSAIKDFLASKGVTCLTLQPEFSDPLHGRRDSAIRHQAFSFSIKEKDQSKIS